MKQKYSIFDLFNTFRVSKMRRPYYQAPKPSVGRTQSSPIFTTPNKFHQQRTNHKASRAAEECPRGGAVAQRRHKQQQKMADRECSGFEPQNYLRDRCKKCFRLREKHDGMPANFVRVSADQQKEIETVARSQLRSPIVTVRRANSNPAKMLTTSTPTVPATATSSSSTTRKTSLQQQHNNKNYGDTNNISKGRSSGEKAVDEDGHTVAFRAVGKSQAMQMRTIAIESDEIEAEQNANSEKKMPNEFKEDEKVGVKCAKPTETRRRMWKLSAQQDSTKKEGNLDNDDENQRILQQNGSSMRQQQEEDSAQPRPSATTTVLLSKQRQISLGHSNSLREQRKSSRSSMTSCSVTAENSADIKQQNGVDKVSGNDDDAEEEELLSLSSYKSANSILERSANTNGTTTVDELFSAHSVESLNSLSCAESFKTGKSPPFDDPMEDPFMTPKSTSEALHFFGSDDDFERAMTPTAMEFNQQEFYHLRVENRRLQDQCRRYRHERKRWTEWLRKKYGNWKERESGDKREQQQTTTSVTTDGKRMMEEALSEMEAMLDEYREENSALKGRMMLERPAEGLHDRDMMSASASTVISNGPAVVDVQLEERLQMSESMCEQLRRERKELEREIEEMQDQYRVEEIEEFRELQRELEQSAKNGRILQFKLRKAERQRDQLQTEKNLLARKVQEIQRGIGAGGTQMEEELVEGEYCDTDEQMDRKVAELEQELRVAKEVSLKLHNELEVAEEKRYKLEDELFYQKEKVRELLAQNRWREARQAKGRSVEEALLEASRSAENLPKEVRDTLEREADLREQLRFTEADLQRTRQRLHELERENDELLHRYANLAQRHSEVQSKSANVLMVPPQKPKTMLRSISEGAEIAAAAASVPQNQRNKSEQRKTEQLHVRSASAAETIRIPMGKEQTILMEQSEENRKQLSKMAEEANELRRKYANCEHELGELKESAVAYKRMNEELKEQMGNWEENEKRRERKSMEKAQKAEKEVKELRKQLADECLKHESAERSLVENRAVLEKLNTTIIETNAELNRSRQKVGELEQEQDKLKKWESKCREMKQERVRIQANAMELKKRTDEAVQELGKMSKTHQQKEAGWMREKKQLEEQLRLLTNSSRTDAWDVPEATGSQSSSAATTLSESQQKQRQQRMTTERMEELEQEKKGLEAKIEELKKIREQELASFQTEKQHWQREREQMTSKIQQTMVQNGVESQPNSSSSVNYKQIADNALRAAEALQKQYREYQKHYTAEVQRLSGQLIKLEQELAAQQQQQHQIAIVSTTHTRRAAADQQQQRQLQDENHSNDDSSSNGVNVSAVIKMPTQYQQQQKQLAQQQKQQQHLTRSHRGGGYDSPSLSSLTENNFTDNTTWDSRLLDCGSMMTRSISPLKGQSSVFKGVPTVPMLQCRTVDIHPSSPLAGLGQRGIDVGEDGDFGSVDDVQQKYRRTGSAGTNILYRIRREELAQGKHPTVRQMARAFESFEKLQQKGNSSEEPRRKRLRPAKGGLFGLLGKSSSMEVSSMTEKNVKTPKAFRKGERAPTENVPCLTERVGGGGTRGSHSPLPSSTLPRGGRNPFKGISSRIVERVRRSLSRSKTKSGGDAVAEHRQNSGRGS